MPALPTVLPAPRTPDPMDAPALRWGVLGTDWIAERFVSSVRRHTRQRFTAVASADASRAKAFADRHDVPHAYGSYQELAMAADVDVVHVATEHTAHLDCARISPRTTPCTSRRRRWPAASSTDGSTPRSGRRPTPWPRCG